MGLGNSQIIREFRVCKDRFGTFTAKLSTKHIVFHWKIRCSPYLLLRIMMCTIIVGNVIAAPRIFPHQE